MRARAGLAAAAAGLLAGAAVLPLGGPGGAARGLGSLASNTAINFTQVQGVLNLVSSECGNSRVLPWVVELVTSGGADFEVLVADFMALSNQQASKGARANASRALITEVATNDRIQRLIQGPLVRNISENLNISCILESDMMQEFLRNEEAKIAKTEENWNSSVGGIIIQGLFDRMPRIFGQYDRCGGGAQQLLELAALLTKAFTDPPVMPIITFTAQSLIDFYKEEGKEDLPTNVSDIVTSLQAFPGKLEKMTAERVCKSVW